MPRQALKPGERGEITTRKLPDGRVVARAYYRTVAGALKDTTARAKTAGEARRRVSANVDKGLREASDTSGTSEAVDEPLFATIADEWLDYGDLQVRHGTKAATTQHEHARLVRKHLKPEFSAMPVSDVTSEIVFRYYTRLASEYAPLARNVKGVLSQIMAHAANLGYITTNPVATVKSIRRKRKEIFAPDTEELQLFRAAVVDYLEDDERPGPTPSTLVLDVVDLILATGFRISEVLGLRIEEDIHLLETTPYAEVNGAVKERGGKRWEPFPKTEAGRREVDLAPFAIDVITRRIANARPGQVYLFETRSGKPNGPQDVHRALRNIRKHAGLPDDYIPHALRKSVGTSVAREAGLESAASVLGHARSRVTEQHYFKRDRRTFDPRDIVQQQFDAITKRPAGR